MAYVTKGQKADYDLVKSRIEGFYPDLVECQMTYGILLAHPSASNPERPPLVSKGFPVTGVATKSNSSQRTLGALDVTIALDAPFWSNLDDDGKAAEIDHWLYRLQLQRDKKTKVYKTDDADRPISKMRAHDKEVGVYDEVVRRHGRKAPESRAVEDLSLHYNTLLPPDGNGKSVGDRSAGKMMATIYDEVDAAEPKDESEEAA